MLAQVTGRSRSCSHSDLLQLTANRTVAILALSLGGLVVLLFLYVLLVHWLRGVEPDVSADSYPPYIFLRFLQVSFMEELWRSFSRDSNTDGRYCCWMVIAFDHARKVDKSRVLQGYRRR